MIRSSSGFSSLAKSLTGVDTDPITGLNHLKELAEQKNAEDKLGSFAAGTGIIFLALCISFSLYSLTMKAFPSSVKSWVRNNDLTNKYNPTGGPKEPDAKDFFDMLLDLAEWLPLGGAGVFGGTIIYRMKKKAGRQRQMEECMQEEMDRLKEALTKETENLTSAAGVTDNKPSFLSGATIVQLFNSFAALMGLKNEELKRSKEETALEYFNRISESVKYPKQESIKASRYFDDELYAKKLSTQEDKAAFMKLLLAMLDSIDIKNKKAKKVAA